MKTDNRVKVRNFHQAKWDEEIIFELNNPGERGVLIPLAEQDIVENFGELIDYIPAEMIRTKLPELPQISQMRVLKHFLRLSQENLGADLNIDIGQGTCTVKYNPKINETFARNHKCSKLHPHQDESTVQGALQVIYEMDKIFQEISGMHRFSFQPSSGSHAILNMASIMQKYHEVNGNPHKNELITTIFSHPSDAAAAAVKGYKIVTIYSDKNGLPDLESLKNVLSENTAGLFITNPEDVGIYNPLIKEFTDLVHQYGGLCGYDQANANGILGVTRAKEAGFDMCFFNLHKTFGTPHGCGGPAAGAIGVTKELEEYLPAPLVDFDGEKFLLNYNLQHSIRKTRMFYGPFPVVLKAYAWIMSMGAQGLKETAHIAVLNNNYLLKKITEIKGASSPFPAGKHRIEQVRYSWEKLTKDTGCTSHDITLRMADFGFHLWSSHHPFIVPEPFTIEPTEAYSKQELDEYVETLKHIVNECYTNPQIVKTAPHNSVVHKIDESCMDDPEKWAVTWRAYKKKHC